MTLVVGYKNFLICDRMVALQGMHTHGQFVRRPKLYIHPDKTLAFGVCGATLSHAENVILGIQLEEAIRENKSNGYDIPFPAMARWGHKDVTILAMTKKGFYHFSWRPSKGGPHDREGDVPILAYNEAEYPIGGGTGMMIASIALQEGVKPKDLTKFVTYQEATVSMEYDMVTKAQLREFKK